MSNEETAKPDGHASKWLVRVLLASLPVLLIKGIVGWRFGNPELLALFMGTLLLILMGPRWLKFRGTWRITGMLVLMGIAAVVAQFLLVPYNALQRQRAAVQRITDQGGRVNIWWASQYSSSSDVEGWSQTPDGWMVPTFLFRWWEKYLRLGQISDLEIPASLVVKDVLQDLQPRSAYRLKILLDGTNLMDPNYREFFPDLPKSDPRWHFFQCLYEPDPFKGASVERLKDNDLQSLQAVKDGEVWIHVSSPWLMNMDPLIRLNRPFSLSIGELEGRGSPSIARIVKESSHLESLKISVSQAGSWQPIIDALNERTDPIELEISEHGYANRLTEAEWKSLSVVKNVHTLICRYGLPNILQGTEDRFLTAAELDGLAMPDLERLEVSKIDRLPKKYDSPKLRSIVAKEVASFDVEDLRPMLTSSIREIIVEAHNFNEGKELLDTSWLDAFQHVKLNQQTLR